MLNDVKIGDEIVRIAPRGGRINVLVVTHIRPMGQGGSITGIAKNGRIYTVRQRSLWKKTDRHFEGFEKIIDQMLDNDVPVRDAMEKARQESQKISLKDVYEILDDLEREDIETYGCKIPEGFDAERAKEAIKNKFDGGMI